VDFGYLVSFVFSWKKWEKTENLKKHAADSPDVHLVAVVAVCHQALRSSVPAGGNVLCERGFVVKASTAAEVGELDGLSGEKNIFPKAIKRLNLRLYVSVENAVAMHVLDCFEQLIYVRLHAGFGEIVGSAFDGFV